MLNVATTAELENLVVPKTCTLNAPIFNADAGAMSTQTDIAANRTTWIDDFILIVPSQ